VLVAVLALAMPVAYLYWGPGGALAAILAAAICGSGAAASLIVRRLLSGSGAAVAGVVLSMFLKSGVPLTAIAVFAAVGGRVLDCGIVPLVLVFYVVCMLFETFVAVRGANASRA